MGIEVLPDNAEQDVDWLRERLFELKYWFIDETPKEIIHSNSLESRYKIRTSWFTSLVWTISIALDNNLLGDKRVKNKAKNFINWYGIEVIKEPPKTNRPEYINKANSMIDEVLQSVPVKPLELSRLG